VKFFQLSHDGQTFVEYTVLLGIVVTFLLAMTPMFRRGVSGLVRTVSDQVGRQNESDQPGGDSGHLVNSYIITRMNKDVTTRNRAGVVSYLYAQDLMDVTIKQESNLGLGKQ
jgi:hypothetical protein